MNQIYSEQLINKNPQFRNLTAEQVKNFLIARTKNLEEPNFKMEHRDLVNITVLDHYACKIINNNENIAPGSILDAYFKQLGLELQKHPLLIYSLPICNIDVAILSKYISNIGSVQQSCLASIQKINQIKQKFLNNQATIDEINYMLIFLNHYISFDRIREYDPFFNEVAKFLFNCDTLGLNSASFCLKYFGYKKCVEENLVDVVLLVGHFDNPNTLGGQLNGTVTLSKEALVNTSFKNNSFEEYKKRSNGSYEGSQMLKTMYHELRHVMQDKDKYEKKETDLSYSFAALEIVNQLDNDEYKRNYTTYDIESDANRYGYKWLLETLKKINPDDRSVDFLGQFRYGYQLKYDFNYRNDEDNRCVLTGKYLKQMLDAYFIQNPDSLKNYYPQYLKFYQPDGKPIPLTKLLAEKHGNYPETLFNQIVGRIGEKIDVNDLATYTLEQKSEMMKNIETIVYLLYSKISFCKDRLTVNNFEINSFGNYESQLMVENCNLYFGVVRGYAKLANYLIQNYPELKNICTHKISQINMFAKLIITDSMQINSAIASMNIGQSIIIDDIPFLEEDNGMGRR